MKLKDIDKSLMEQDTRAEIPTGGTPPAPPSTGGRSMSDFERNVLNMLGALSPGVGRAANLAGRAVTRLGLSQAGRELDQIKAAELAARKADLVQQAKAGTPFSNVRQGIELGPTFDIPPVGSPQAAAAIRSPGTVSRQDPADLITSKSMDLGQRGPLLGKYRDPATGRYARYTSDTSSGPALGTATDTASKNVATATARELGVPATKQSTDLGVSSLTRQVPGQGLPMPSSGLTPRQVAALGAGTLATGGSTYNTSDASSSAPTTRPAGTASAALAASAASAPTQAASAASAPARAASAASGATGSSAMPTATPGPGVAVATGQGVRGGSPTSADISKQVQQLASASGITNPNQIKAGQQIILPGGGTYTVKPGDNLWNISKNMLRGTMREDQELSEIKRLSGI